VIGLLLAWLVLSVLFGLAWQREMRRLARVAEERAEQAWVDAQWAAIRARHRSWMYDDFFEQSRWRLAAEERLALSIVRPESFMAFTGTVL
jgi:hypothetical protein